MRNCFSSLNCSSRGSDQHLKHANSHRKHRTILVVVEPFQEYQKFLLVPPQNSLNLRGFFRVRHKDLNAKREVRGRVR